MKTMKASYTRLRVGIAEPSRDHGICRTTRYSPEGDVLEVRDQSVAQAQQIRNTNIRIEHMTETEKQELLRQLTKGADHE